MTDKQKLSEEDIKFVEETKKLLEYLDENPLPEPIYNCVGPKEYDGIFALPSGVKLLLNGEPMCGVQKWGFEQEKKCGWIQYFINSNLLLDKFETPGQLKAIMTVGKKEVVLYEALTKFSHIGLEVNASDMLILVSMHWEQLQE